MGRTALLWLCIMGLIPISTMRCSTVNEAVKASEWGTETIYYYTSDDRKTERVNRTEDFPFVLNVNKEFKEDGKITKVWYGLTTINFWFEQFNGKCIVSSTIFQSEEDFQIALGPNWAKAKVDSIMAVDCERQDKYLEEALKNNAAN